MALLENRPYSFSEIFQLNIPAADLLPALGYRFSRQFVELPVSSPVDVSSLVQEFQEVLPYTDLNSEQARRETIVSSIVKFLVRQTQCRLSYEYPLKSEKVFGNVDYFIQKQGKIIIVEAKRDDLENGFNQVAAELIALDTAKEIYTETSNLLGAITIGTLWQFAILERERQQIVQALNTYRVPEDLQSLIPILLYRLVAL